MKAHDYLVIGSGCSGAMAAQTLVEAGVKVALLDVGVQAKENSESVPDKDFLSIRKTDPEQYRYLIGPTGEGISWGNISKGAQVTPPRLHMTKLVDKYLPLDSATFSPLESLGYGGLAIGWGLQCWEYSDADLKRSGLNISKMRSAYETVSRRIGVSATNDDAAAYTIGSLRTYQPSATMDRNHRYISAHYTRHKESLQRAGIFVGRTPLALITQDYDGRQAYNYNDMDFYANQGQSAWRPNITIDTLRKQSNFTYLGGQLVISFAETKEGVTVKSLDVKTGKLTSVRCRKLILASGALGTARIVLRSLGQVGSRVPILSNPHSYMPCLLPTMIGKEGEPHKLSLGQLSYFIDPEGSDSGISVASSYSYQSLMLFRIVNQAPLNFSDARIIMRYLASGLVIMIIQHPDSPTSQKYLTLTDASDSPTGDKLQAYYSLSNEEEALWSERERRYQTTMRKFRAYAIKRMDPGHGSSIHYAGTLPYSKTTQDFRLSPSGRLHGTRHVYVADSSGFNYLPAKGLTFSLMANAHLTAQNVLKEVK